MMVAPPVDELDRDPPKVEVGADWLLTIVALELDLDPPKDELETEGVETEERLELNADLDPPNDDEEELNDRLLLLNEDRPLLNDPPDLAPPKPARQSRDTNPTTKHTIRFLFILFPQIRSVR